MPNDTKIANIARRLANAIRDAGYTRKPDDKKLVAELQHALVVEVSLEEDEVEGAEN